MDSDSEQFKYSETCKKQIQSKEESNEFSMNCQSPDLKPKRVNARRGTVTVLP